MPSTSPTRRDEQADATRAALIASARRLFTEQGYAATSTSAVVRAAAVGTRGALYHHFPDKESLFAAVFEGVQADLGVAVDRRVRRVSPRPRTSLGVLQATVRAFLDCLIEQPAALAMFRDGPFALGWAGFREVETRYAGGALRQLLRQAASEGALVDVPLEPLTRCLIATLDEAAMAVATSPSPRIARTQWSAVLIALVGGLTAG